MRIVLAGGSGQIGKTLARSFDRQGHQCVILTRRPGREIAGSLRQVGWDGETPGPWCAELEGADVVINLAGRSVDCRYNAKNLRAMLQSRIRSTCAIGLAIAAAARPPGLWLQASTATIYSHRFDAPNDEHIGIIGGNEPGVPAIWRRSVEIALAWEAALASAHTPQTRKVALRAAMTMTPDRGGVFDVLSKLCKFGAGRQGDGRQYVSWIHEVDFCAAVNFIIAHGHLSGAINLCAPEPLPNRDFIAGIHHALGSTVSIPLPKWTLELGAFFLRTETELLLKSRRVVPTRLREAGFKFDYPTWPGAAQALLRQSPELQRR